MKKVILSTACLIVGLNAFSQRAPSHPMVQELAGIKDPKLLQLKLKSLAEGSEPDLLALFFYYQQSKKSTDSLTEIAVRRFPKSRLSLYALSKKFNEEKDPIAQEKILSTMKNAFPERDHSEEYIVLAMNMAIAKHPEKAGKYFALTNTRLRSGSLTKIPAAIMTYDANAAETFITKELASPAITKTERQSLLNTYSSVLAKKGDYNKAFEIMKEYVAQLQRRSPAVMAQYAYLQSKTGDHQGAFKELENAVIAAVGGEEVRNELKLAYSKLNPDKNTDEYLSGLAKNSAAKYKEEVAKKITKEKAPEFTVTDLSGKTVSLSDFKGKTIVIDFWATWCGPCKASLPAMQAAVNNYKNDPNVAFLFIHTLESSSTPTEDAKKYFADNNYRLPLYMDLKDPATRKNKAVDAFQVKGIPAKFVIDGNGNIRFRASGFNGNNEAAVGELSAMIELARKG